MRLLESYWGTKNHFPYPGVTKNKNYHWLLTIAFSLFAFTLVAAATQSSMVATHMAEKMHTSQSAILLADSLRMCATAAMLFPADWLYKKLGLRNALMLGCALWTIPNFVYPFLTSVGWLYVFKILQGMNSFCFPLMLSTILKWAPSKDHGSVSSIYNGFYMSGACLGSITVMLAEKVNAWYMSSILVGLVALAGWIATAYVAVDKDDAPAEAMPKPISGRKLLSMPATWLMIVAFSACNWVDLSVNTDLPVYAQFLGFSVSSSGTLMIIISVSTLVSSLIAGKVSDFAAKRCGTDVLRQRVMVFAAGFVVAMASFVGVIFARSYAALVVFSVITMAGASWSNGTFWAIPPLLYSADDLESGTSTVTAFSNLVNPVATFVVGVLCGGRGAWTAAWTVSILVCLISMTCGCLLVRHKS